MMMMMRGRVLMLFIYEPLCNTMGWLRLVESALDKSMRGINCKL